MNPCFFIVHLPHIDEITVGEKKTSDTVKNVFLAPPVKKGWTAFHSRVVEHVIQHHKTHQEISSHSSDHATGMAEHEEKNRNLLGKTCNSVSHLLCLLNITMISRHYHWVMDYTLPLCGLRSSKQCKLKNGENKE